MTDRKKIRQRWLFLMFPFILSVIVVILISISDPDKAIRAESVSRTVVNVCFLLNGLACFGYYFFCGKRSGFGLRGLKLWLILGTVLLARAGIVHFSLLRFGRGSISPYVYFVLHTFCLFFFACFLLMEGYVAWEALRPDPEHADWLIILGAQSESPVLFSRVDAAADFMENHGDTRVIASGGQGSNEPISEAESMARRLRGRGIRDERILLEDRSRTTAENLRNSKTLLPADIPDVALVTDDYHMARAKYMASCCFGCRVQGLPVHQSRVTLPHYMMREFFAACKMVLLRLRGKAPETE